MVAFLSGAVLTAANLNASLNQLTIRTVTGTSDTLVLADQGGAVSYSNASATTSTIPPNSSVAYATGTKIVLINLGAGVVTVTAGAGVTINGTPLTLAQNAGGTCIKTATNTWSFLPFSSGVGAANFSDAATGTYTGFKYKTFTASGTLTVTTAGFADIVVVGPGGAGSARGGGGAGGVLSVTNAYLPVGTLTVTVGAGGAPSASEAFGGLASRFDSYYAIGGGGGSNTINAQPGGSGGGGANATTAGSGIAGQGNTGGTGGSGAGGGGGGAGAVGGNFPSNNNGGTGGAGTTITIAGTTPSGSYVAGSYAVGGGGGGGGVTSGGAGGSGGGGAGSALTGTAGTVNTGGGGGGGSTNGGAAGGSGIVIVRVAV